MGRPDYTADTNVNTAIGTQLDINNLDKIGLRTSVSADRRRRGERVFGSYIDRYGYVSPTTGQKTGGGLVGYGTLFDNDDFYRTSWQVAYNVNFGSKIIHDLHFGFQ